AVAFGWAAYALTSVARRWISSVSAATWTATGLMTLVFALVPNPVTGSLLHLQRTHRALVYQAHLREDAARAIVDLGGPAKVLKCGTVMTEGFQVPMLAWTLGVRTLGVEAPPTHVEQGGPWPNTILQARDTSKARLLPLPAQIIAWEHAGARYTTFRVRTFIVFSTCAK
ncbi:MAG: hypothetical protein M3025_09745, partial [Actinomycetota bacterium]|nr:hypothetical protein [Actinomycetota bacterium]